MSRAAWVGSALIFGYIGCVVAAYILDTTIERVIGAAIAAVLFCLFCLGVVAQVARR
jgi:energy-converting hydrogenase Eha subunit C